MAAVSIDNFAAFLEAEVEQEVDKINRSTKQVVTQAANACIDDLKATPAHKDISGAYRNGWRKRVEGNPIVGYTATVYQQAKPGLPHLIELGHGGPHPASPHPHMEQAYETGAKKLMEVVEHG